jgi:peptide deformylase
MVSPRPLKPKACWLCASNTKWDHLMGKVFVEYLSPLKRNRIKTKLLKEEREEQGASSSKGRY